MSDQKSKMKKIWRAQQMPGIDFLTARFASSVAGSSHMHHGYTISIVENGTLPMMFKDCQILINPGDFLLLGPEVPHAFSFTSMLGICSYRTVFVKNEYLSGRLRAILAQQSMTIAQFKNERLWADYLGMQKSIEAGSLSDIGAFSKFSEKLLEEMPLNTVSHTEILSPHIRLAKNYLNEYYTELPNIDELSKIVNISPFYLSRLFKKEVGIPPHAYINQLRINKAKDMIKNGYTLQQVTYDLGFTDQSHFCRTFLKLTGVTPTDYI